MAFALNSKVWMGSGKPYRLICEITIEMEIPTLSDMGPTPEMTPVVGISCHRDQPVVRLNGDLLLTRNQRLYMTKSRDVQAFTFEVVEKIPLGAWILNPAMGLTQVETIEDARETRDVVNVAPLDYKPYFVNGFLTHPQALVA